MKRDPIIWAYCRVSTAFQKIDRQERNILSKYPTAVVVRDYFSGTTNKRPEFEKMLKALLPGDTIVFDEVSRMSRTGTEGFLLWKGLFEEGIHLVFLKEPHINTSVYRDVLSNQIPMTGEDIDLILDGVNKYLMRLAEKQIELAFDRAKQEIDLLHKRTSEGMRTAKLNGKQIGRVAGRTYDTKKFIATKELILKHNKAFGGSLNDKETIALTGINRNTFYVYKKQLLNAKASDR